jgi:hypothetical protein
MKCHKDKGIQLVTGTEQRLQGLDGTLYGVSKRAIPFAIAKAACFSEA